MFVAEGRFRQYVCRCVAFPAVRLSVWSVSGSTFVGGGACPAVRLSVRQYVCRCGAIPAVRLTEWSDSGSAFVDVQRFRQCVSRFVAIPALRLSVWKYACRCGAFPAVACWCGEFPAVRVSVWSDSSSASVGPAVRLSVWSISGITSVGVERFRRYVCQPGSTFVGVELFRQYVCRCGAIPLVRLSVWSDSGSAGSTSSGECGKNVINIFLILQLQWSLCLSVCVNAVNDLALDQLNVLR